MNHVKQGNEDTAINPVDRSLQAATGSLPQVVAPAFGTTADAWLGLSRDLIERFIEVSLVRHAWPRSARRGCRGDLVAFDAWMRARRGRTLVSARGNDLRGFLASRIEAGMEARLAARAVDSLQEFFHYLQESGSRSDNPARRLRPADGVRSHARRLSRAASH
jgi:site-specific recombinase XerD